MISWLAQERFLVMPDPATPADPLCGICDLHANAAELAQHEIWRNDHWLLRHHPQPAPLLGWCLLDSLRHLSGPSQFEPEEAMEWGVVVQNASMLVQSVTGCDRVYAIAFGEGARHLHLHLIPRFADDPRTSAWSVADHYRAVASGEVPAVSNSGLLEAVTQARVIASAWVI